MATLTLTLTSAAVPGSPITRTVTFGDADFPNILAAYRKMLSNPALTGSQLVTWYAQMIGAQIGTITQSYLTQQSPPAAPTVTQS